MKRFRHVIAAVVLSFAPATIAPAFAEGLRQEAAEHPRIAKAIVDLEDAIKYMESAPHDFGGHKAEAIAASRKALEQLQYALKYRAVTDTKHAK